MSNSMQRFENLPVRKPRKPKGKQLIIEGDKHYNTHVKTRPLEKVDWAQSVLADRKAGLEISKQLSK